MKKHLTQMQILAYFNSPDSVSTGISCHVKTCPFCLSRIKALRFLRDNPEFQFEKVNVRDFPESETDLSDVLVTPWSEKDPLVSVVLKGFFDDSSQSFFMFSPNLTSSSADNAEQIIKSPFETKESTHLDFTSGYISQTQNAQFVQPGLAFESKIVLPAFPGKVEVKVEIEEKKLCLFFTPIKNLPPWLTLVDESGSESHYQSKKLILLKKGTFFVEFSLKRVQGSFYLVCPAIDVKNSNR